MLFRSLVVSNNSKSNRLEDQIFWYKASGHNDFKLGAKEFREMSKNLGSDDDEDDYDADALRRKKGPKINVKKNRW